MNELNWTKGFFNKPSESMNNELLKQETADTYFRLIEMFTDEIEKEAQNRYPINNSTKDLYIPSNAAFQHGVKYGLHLASLRSKELQKEIHELKKHRDEKEVMIQAFNKICNLFSGYKWIIEGRGPYAYDDDGYRLEVTHLFTEFQFIRQDTWDNIQSRTADYKHALLKDAQDYVAEMLRIKIAGRDQTIELQRKQIDESLEAYNRECKRVDELTEEVDKGKELIMSLYQRISEQHKRNEELEGLLKRAHESMSNPGFTPR